MIHHNPLTEAVAVLRNARRIAIGTHVDPDPDAIGSSLGLALALQSLSKAVVVLCDDPIPYEVDFLPGQDLYRSRLPDGFAPELLVALDAGDAERLGQVAVPLLAAGLPVVNIDHHVTNTRFGQVNLVDAAAASTAEMLVAVIETLEVHLTPAIAACLLAGIVGDTRRFTTSSVVPGTLEAAGHLVAAGADMAAIAEAIFERRSVDTLKLWGLALANLHVDGSVIWTALPIDKRRQLGLSGAVNRGLANLLLSAREASISAVFTEQEDGQIEISLRARPGWDVASVAVDLGGGGHALAAGATISGPLEAAVARVVKLLKDGSGQVPAGRDHHAAEDGAA